MSTSEGQNIDQKVFDKLDQIDRKKMEKKIPALRDKQIYSHLPNDVIESDHAFNLLREKTGVNDSEIADSLGRLVQNENVVKSTGYHTNKTFFRKNPYIKPL